MFSKIWATKLNYEKQTDLFASNDAHGVYMLVYEEETGKIIVELKCVSKLVNANKAQVINYLHGTHFAVGLLVNFGESSLKWERLTLLKNSEDR